MKIIIMIDRCLSMLTSSVEKLPSTFPVAAAMIACRRVGKHAMMVSIVACDDGDVGDGGDGDGDDGDHRDARTKVARTKISC